MIKSAVKQTKVSVSKYPLETVMTSVYLHVDMGSHLYMKSRLGLGQRKVDFPL
jgi:hypothetical protein